jgi:hypothetical protein
MTSIKSGETVTATASERTWRVEIFCEYGTEATLVAHRETVFTDPAGKVVARDRSTPAVRRSASEVPGIDTQPIYDAIDKLAAEDKARAAMPPPLPAPLPPTIPPILQPEGKADESRSAPHT